MLKHDKKLAAAWKKKDKTEFLRLLAARITKGIKRDAKKYGYNPDDLLDFGTK